MALVLYNYVYLLSRSAFLEQVVAVLEASHTLGCSPWKSFMRVGLPIARPSIMVSITLALMEALNDFGTVDYLAVRTLSASIFNVWLHMCNLGGGAQIAVVVLLFVGTLILLERAARRRKCYHSTGNCHACPPRIRLDGWMAGGTVATCLPAHPAENRGAGSTAGQRRRHPSRWHPGPPASPSHARNNSLVLAASTTAVALGLFLAYTGRLGHGALLTNSLRIDSLGYATPGAMLRVGILYPFGHFDNMVDAFMQNFFDLSTGLLLSGTMFTLLYTYIARFLALSVRYPGSRTDPTGTEHSPHLGAQAGGRAAPGARSPASGQSGHCRHSGFRGYHEGTAGYPDAAPFQF